MYRFFDFTIAASIVKSSYNDPSKSTGNCFEPTVPSFLSMLLFFSSLVGSWNLLKILSKSMCFYVYSSLIRSENRYTETHCISLFASFYNKLLSSQLGKKEEWFLSNEPIFGLGSVFSTPCFKFTWVCSLGLPCHSYIVRSVDFHDHRCMS